MTSPVGGGGVDRVIDEEEMPEGASDVSRKETSLAKFGIIEDVSGGTFVI